MCFLKALRPYIYPSLFAGFVFLNFETCLQAQSLPSPSLYNLPNLSSVLDRALGSTVGYVATRTSSGWAAATLMAPLTTTASNAVLGLTTPANSGLFIKDGSGNELFRLFASTWAVTPTSYGTGNLFIGRNSGAANPGDNSSAGFFNTGVGEGSLKSNTTGEENIALGLNAMEYNTTGNYNLAAGVGSLEQSIGGSSNVALGHHALILTTQSYNVGIGDGAVGNATSSTNNTGVGYTALFNYTGAGAMTALGSGAGSGVTTGAGCTYIGINAGTSNTTCNNSFVFGSSGDATLTSALRIYSNGNPIIKTDINSPIIQNGANEIFYTNSAQSTGQYMALGGSAWFAVSDARVKKNIKRFSVLDKLSGYRAVSYRNMLTHKDEIGVIAQEQADIFPSFVHRGSGGPTDHITGLSDPKAWTVSYDRYGAVALEGVKELLAEVRRLKAEVKALKRAIN